MESEHSTWTAWTPCRTGGECKVQEIMDREEVYQVEIILKHRSRGQKNQYLIKWEGYLITEASWEPESAFLDDRDLLSTYEQKHQLWKRWWLENSSLNHGLGSFSWFLKKEVTSISGRTAWGSWTTNWRHPWGLFLSSTYISHIYQPSWLLPPTGQQIHNSNS